MKENQDFDLVFKDNSEAKKIAENIRKLIAATFQNIEEKVYGGAKVKLALYSEVDTKLTLCGLQEGKEDSCMLYVHHVPVLDHPRLEYSGKGKHAKTIRFTSVHEVVDEDIVWLFNKVKEALN